MQPITAFPKRDLEAIGFVLFDIDDTLTHGGRLPAIAYDALERLHEAGLKTVPITGRPAGWCDHIARMWPVDGVVGENGAFYFRYDVHAARMIRRFWCDAEQRASDRDALRTLGERILSEVPSAALSADQPYRECDLAIDICEDVARLPEADIKAIVRLFEAAGAVAKVSSVHVNGWFGDYDKLAMTRCLMSEQFGRDIDDHPDPVVFLGDSPNDAPMFAFFPNSVGVANVRAFTAELTSPPRWITSRPGGFGFAEFADALLQARG